MQHKKMIDTYKNIRGYASTFSEKLKKVIKTGIGSEKPEDEIFAVLMEKENIGRLILHTDCDKLAAIIGLENNQLTVALLCVDKNNKILEEHLTGELDGEEVWTTKIPIKNLVEFLPEPKI